jgi:hypothetical protein
MTAPPGSTLTLTANPDFIPNNGGISVLSAFVIEPAGTTVPDGTIVQFFTTLGRIDPQEARTKNGVARANLISDSRSGTANVTAVSGGAAVAPAPSPTPSPGPQPITAAATATIPVRIGAVLPARVIVTADPSRITISRSTHIFATVLDGNANPVSNIGVIFTVNTPTEFMDSEGHPIFTDTNGRAEDVLRTRSTVPTTVTVTVTVMSSGSVSGAVTVPILLQ